MNPTIVNLETITTAPSRARLVIVKVTTSEPGLEGLGCATFTQRHQAVQSAVESYLKPFLIGKDPHRIQDIWTSCLCSSYWRNGPVLNNALSGVDMALWDIKAKLAGMPLYQLLGGKCREGAAVYVHAKGNDHRQVEEETSSFLAQGFTHVRCQLGMFYGGSTRQRPGPEGRVSGDYFDPTAYARETVRLFAHLRGKFGQEVELLHDVHERLPPIEAIRLAKDLEPFRLFFLEDPFPPEQMDWLRILRSQCAIPIAMGELFTNPSEWTPLIQNRLVDFIRVHVSAIGGITPALKLASLCEAFGIQTAWHGPGDVSPVGHAAQAHLDVSCRNFGIQEWTGFSDAEREIFHGLPEVRNGYLYPPEKPGLGITLDEKAAARFPCPDSLPDWPLARTVDGTAVYP